MGDAWFNLQILSFAHVIGCKKVRTFGLSGTK